MCYEKHKRVCQNILYYYTKTERLDFKTPGKNTVEGNHKLELPVPKMRQVTVKPYGSTMLILGMRPHPPSTHIGFLINFHQDFGKVS